MEIIQNRMIEVLHSNYSGLNLIIDYLLQSSGKMLRPRLVYRSAQLHPHEPKQVIDISVAVELIHLASLLHDDVIDEAHVRRGRESVNIRWGNQASVITGDYLFAAAFNLINQHGLDEVMDSITSTIQLMCTGEIKQMALNSDLDICEEEYYDKTYRKTACLFASACRVGALTAETPSSQVQLLYDFGLNLGYAYQIMDDVLDFTAEAKQLGKPSGNDLTQGNITLPIILALKDWEWGMKLRNLIEAGKSSKDKLPLIVSMLWESGALEQCMLKSRQFLQRALESINLLPVSPERQALQDLACRLMDTCYGCLPEANTGQGWWSTSGNTQ
ncbi:MAG: polyprenyl synthetase family protein [Syntrophomonadaceae bacterium]|jgi:heptaprenyl diphosphate synthase|nr:polyprenyl synthetase family protein [Syntrophomonadaceae bacterium]